MVAKNPEYLVSHGKTGALGRFLSASPEDFRRGDRVILDSERGLTFGVVVCTANEGHAKLLGGVSLGTLLRRADSNDQAIQKAAGERERDIFELSRGITAKLNLPMEIIDCEVSLDGRRVILQYLLGGTCDPAPLVGDLESRFGLEVWLENLALPPEDQSEGGCGEPNCGRTSGGGGCETCGSGGGCSSCGSGKVDMRAYFAHLRDQMEAKGRTALV